MPIDYSKWNNIEISDDEDDQHPNIDTASLNKWRHEARLQRMAEAKDEKEKFEKERLSHQQKLAAMKEKLKDAKDQSTEKQLKELEKQEAEFRRKEEELRKKERLQPWNIDTICHEGKSKTLINRGAAAKTEELSDDDKMEKQKKFTEKNRDLLKKFGMFRKYDDSERFLTEHPDLTCEETANYLVLWCIDLAVEEKNDLMAHVAHQTIVMQFILELARSLKIDPRGCVKAFFHRIRQAEKQYIDAFNDELESFKGRVRERAEVRIETARREIEEEERQARLGPGGLDPVEVMESLPKEMQECFESKDIAKLQEVIAKMDQKEAAYHMKRCVDSGMWVPNANDKVSEEDEEGAKGEAEDGAVGGAPAEGEEETYEQVD